MSSLKELNSQEMDALLDLQNMEASGVRLEDLCFPWEVEDYKNKTDTWKTTLETMKSKGILIPEGVERLVDVLWRISLPL